MLKTVLNLLSIGLDLVTIGLCLRMLMEIKK